MAASHELGRARSSHGGLAYRAGIAVAGISSLLSVWTTIVRDDGNGAGSFMVILAVIVGWFAAGFRPSGMARAMAGVAIMQVMLGMLIATAPVTEAILGGPTKALVSCGGLAVLWLLSGAFFRKAGADVAE